MDGRDMTTATKKPSPAVTPLDKMQARLAVEDMMREYAACIDDGRYEQWPAFFTDECRYQIIPAESHALGYVSGFYLCESRGMLADRILCLRETAIYEPHRYRHLIGGTRVVALEGETCRAETPFAVIRTSNEGEMILFAAGKYIDTVVFGSGEPKFREKLVLTDSTRIDMLIAAPL
jgi:anthranilate 1,2-dioxygenase small subunit